MGAEGELRKEEGKGQERQEGRQREDFTLGAVSVLENSGRQHSSFGNCQGLRT